MKYILVIDHIATGGAERILIDYYRHLDAKGCKVMIFVLSGHEGQSEWTKGLNVIYGSDEDHDNVAVKAIEQVCLLLKLWWLVRKFRPDVVFSFLEKSNLLAAVIRTKAIKVLTVHNVLSIQYTKIQSAWVRKVLYRMIRRMYDGNSNVIAVSEQVKDDLITSFGVKEQNIHVINNFVERDEIARKSGEVVDNYKFDRNVKYVMSIGRFSDQKAQWKLLKAFSVYVKDSGTDNVRLVLMGRGEHEDRLKQLVCDLGITGKVDILPFNANPYKYMSHAYLFVLSSIFEGFPIVLAEASFLRIPFVGSRKAIPEEMFSDVSTWNKCVYDTKMAECDFSTKIHSDERTLAKLIRYGVENEEFRQEILQATEKWENNNQKSYQFKCYDGFTTNQQQ